MIVKWLKQSNSEEYDISDFVSTITWSGSVGQASRQLEITVIYSPIEKNIQEINISIGDRLKLLTDGGALLIDTMVYSRERKSEQGTVQYSSYDDLNRLLKSSGTYIFKNTTPEAIVRTVCNDLQVGIGRLVETKVPVKKMLVDSENIYNIIMKAYTKAYQSTGKKYMPLMIGRKLNVIEKGDIVTGFLLQDDYNITSSSYSESLDSMINKVRIYNDKGNQIGEVKTDEWINKYGIFQGAYTKEDGVNQTTAAKNMLTGINQEASIEALGNTACISGYGVQIRDSLTGLWGKFWIDTDTHTWQNGVYTMSLDLTFKNLMDIQEVEA
ncbi:XkdQ/YqbQ family protein [Anaerocolumna chitinilytica]|uniref:YqbQ/XkdQ domain-containing protein n=1 Tax=Anaerocolumna chitinilytica TaxID=1727145 RepID=A0A7M3S9Y8_9FIRM|nr:hypothetical protein [Anaerocolumna chitinilytica]BCK01406.1 hypothetical protein bsdcttw_44460 [Anaerocolumna chitinilytica]